MKNIKVISKSIFLIILLAMVSVFFVSCDSGAQETVWVQFDKSKIAITLGQSEQLHITIKPSDAKNQEYVISTNNENIVSVSQNGLIQAIGVGTATITATSAQGGNSANCIVTVLPKPTTLSVPQNIAFDGEKIVWDEVENNYGYRIKLNEEILTNISVKNFFRDFNIGITNTISIQSIGNKLAYVDSAWSEEFTFTQLNAPRLEISNRILHLNSDISNAKYDLYLDGKLKESNFNKSEYILPNNLSTGIHTYKAKLLGNNESIYSSLFSEDVVIKKLDAPKNAMVNASILSFDAVNGAENYIIEKKEITTNTKTYKTTISNEYNLGENYKPGKYDIKIMSRGNGSTTLDSEYSIKVAIDKLNAPTNLQINNGVISWEQDFTPRNGFLLKIRTPNSNENNVQTVPTNENEYNFEEHFKNPGLYTISIIATGDDANSDNIRYINSSESEVLNLTKLNTPNNARISNNKLVWSNVESAQKYEILSSASNSYNTTMNEFEFLDNIENKFAPGKHEVRVRAIGNGKEILDSQYTDIVPFKKLNSLQKSDFSINQGKLFWNNIDNCIKYKVYVNEDAPIEVNTNNINMDNKNFTSLNYQVKVQAISSVNEFVMGEPSETFEFQKLGTPTNIGVKDGNLSWQTPTGTGIISSYRIKIGNMIYDTKSIKTNNDLNRIMNDNTTGSISIQAICNDDTNQYMWGNFSEPQTFTKLSSNFNAKIENSEFLWDKIKNVNNYLITIKHFENELAIIEHIDLSATNNRALNLLHSEFFQTPTKYYINVKALGITGGQYISSHNSETIEVEKLKTTQNLRVEHGKITWDKDERVDHYEIFVDDISKENIKNDNHYLLNHNYSAGDYKIKIHARGNQVSTINAVEDEKTLDVTKLGSDFSLSINKNFIEWNAIQNANGYAYELRDSTNKIVNINNNLLDPRVDITNVKWKDVYYFKVKACGNDTKYIDGDYSAKPGEQDYLVKLLHAPTNLSIDNGILTWDYVENTNDYEIIIDNTTPTENITHTKKSDIKRGSFNLAEHASTQNLVGNIKIKIQSIGGEGKEAYISSTYSDEISTYKIEAPKLKNIDGILNWDEIKNAQGYTIKIDGGGEPIEIPMSNQTFKYELDNQFGSGNYDITLRANGDENQKKYLTSGASEVFKAYKLPTPSAGPYDLRVLNGEIVWKNVENADLYYLEITKRNINGEFEFFKKEESLKPMPTQNKYSFYGDYGQYKMKIKVLAPSGTIYLNSNIYEYSNVMTKLNAPNDMHIEKGQLKWSPIEDNSLRGYTLNLNGRNTAVGNITHFVFSEEYQAIEYEIKIRSLGNDISTLNSDESKSFMCSKIKRPTISMNDHKLSWRKENSCDHYELEIKNVCNPKNIITKKLKRETILDSLNTLASDFYITKIRFVAGDYASDSSHGIVSSDWSDEFPIYKLAPTENFKLISDFESSDADLLKQLGMLSWSTTPNAEKYRISYKTDSDYRPTVVDNIFEHQYAFSDNSMNEVGKYTISIISTNSEVINHNAINYNVVQSDETSITALKLATPTELQAKNGCLYWKDPILGDNVDKNIAIKYILYWQYVDLKTPFASNTPTNALYINTGNIHKISNGIDNYIIHSYPMSKLGKYKLMLRAVGENCIRSSSIACQDYINYEGTSQIQYIYDLFSSGEGTKENPYIIKNFVQNSINRPAIEQFEYLNYLNNKQFKLCENIILGETFTPIGSKDFLSLPFDGILDGLDLNNIDLHYIDANDTIFDSIGNVGLFSATNSNAIIQNLEIRNMKINGTYNIIGMVTAENAGLIKNINIINSSAKSDFSSAEKMFVGGIAGKNTGAIRHCITNVVLQCTNTQDINYSGGITGYNEGLITQCRVNAVILNNSKPCLNQISGTMVGGIAGFNMGKRASITECSNYAMVYGYTGGSAQSGVSYGYAGGIVGKAITGTTTSNTEITITPEIKNCYNRGIVYSYDNESKSKAGGIIGFISGGTIDSCYNTGEIYVLSDLSENAQNTDKYNLAGAIVGYNDSTNSLVTNSYYEKKAYTQQGMSEPTTPLNPNSNIVSATTDFLKNTLISDKYKEDKGKYQKLAWELPA